jgi:hypothetical protein
LAEFPSAASLLDRFVAGPAARPVRFAVCEINSLGIGSRAQPRAVAEASIKKQGAINQ